MNCALFTAIIRDLTICDDLLAFEELKLDTYSQYMLRCGRAHKEAQSDCHVFGSIVRLYRLYDYTPGFLRLIRTRRIKAGHGHVSGALWPRLSSAFFCRSPANMRDNFFLASFGHRHC